MLLPEEFIKRWDEPLMNINTEVLSSVKLPEKDQVFLLKAGFPNEAAPFLSFDGFKKNLKQVYDIWGNANDYSEKEKSKLDSYYIFGSDGSGSPIAIDIQNQYQIVHLDHDDRFNTITFINSGILEFAQFLLLTKEMMAKANSELTDEQLEQEIPKSYKNDVLNIMKNIDSTALNDGNFWNTEINML